MKNCTFFGHKNTTSHIKPLLKSTIIRLIEDEDVDNFYVGKEGNFDFYVAQVLKEIKATYPHINYSVVLAYLHKSADKDEDYTDTIYPEGLEKVPPKFAIVKRNLWMIKNSDYVIAYVKAIGGAKQFMELAESKGKVVINLADLI